MSERTTTMTVTINDVGANAWRGRAPREQDGARCRFAVRGAGEAAVAYTTTLPEAVALLVSDDEYASRSGDERRAARRRAAAVLAQSLQERFNAGRSDLPAAAVAPKDSAGAGVGAWLGPVPLVLVESHYAPFTTVPAPVGLVLWLRPEDEWMFAQSLTDAGIAQVTATA